MLKRIAQRLTSWLSDLRSSLCKVIKSASVKILASVLFTLCSIILIAWYVDYRQLVLSLQQVNIAWTFVASAFYGCSLMVRSIRMRRLVVLPLNFGVSLGVICRYSVLNYFLPFKLGEISMPLLLRRHGVSMEGAIWVWLLSRLIDLAFVAGVGVYIFWSHVIQILQPAYMAIVIFFLLLGAVLFKSAIVKSVYFSNFYRFLLRLSFRLVVILVVSTCLSWVLLYLTYYYLLVAMGLDVHISVCITALVLMAPITFLPVNSLAGVGGFQAAWVGALVLDGWLFDAALAASVTLHVLISLVVIVIGALLVAAVKLAERRCS